MSIELLQQELAALPPDQRRRMQAFLVALEDSNDAPHRKRLAEKIDAPAAKFATLRELDHHLKIGQNDKL